MIGILIIHQQRQLRRQVHKKSVQHCRALLLGAMLIHLFNHMTGGLMLQQSPKIAQQLLMNIVLVVSIPVHDQVLNDIIAIGITGQITNCTHKFINQGLDTICLLLIFGQNELQQSATINMLSHLLCISFQVGNDEGNPFIWKHLHTLPEHMVGMVVVNALQYMVLQLIGNHRPFALLEYLQCSLQHEAAIQLRGQAENTVFHGLCQAFALLRTAMFNQLLHNVIPELVGHQLYHAGEDLIMKQLLLLSRTLL
mmetsp:Transcript_53248/g.95087  ORF Transcript_53248/g.95087 Transcript_53248/m.95087 type:complete len:253 (-) Transcript_53248:1276-2034(-)